MTSAAAPETSEETVEEEQPASAAPAKTKARTPKKDQASEVADDIPF
jgi:hypothetical protein